MKYDKIPVIIVFSFIVGLFSLLVQKNDEVLNPYPILVLKHPKTIIATETRFSEEIVEEIVFTSLSSV